MQENPTAIFLEQFEEYSSYHDPLIRKMAVRGIGEIGEEKSVSKLEKMLEMEEDPTVIGELTKALYKIKNSKMKWKRLLKNRYIVNENGLIGDDSDKWYADPNIYNTFSEAEDIENVCFELVARKLKEDGIELVNPVDLATGTGRMLKLILNRGDYTGTLYGVDLSKQMLEYLSKSLDRQKGYIYNVELVNSTIENFKIGPKSSFIISSFGFPSKMSNRENCIKELKSVYENLSEGGVFVTIGWDETFNDELNEMWYKYIPDDITADSFEEWRNRRASIIKTPRNCNLKWLKTNMNIPLQFTSIEESVNVMGHLFGRDAATDILNSRQKEWWMSMGITYNTKEEIKEIIEKMEEAK